jgi:hypothetical protein
MCGGCSFEDKKLDGSGSGERVLERDRVNVLIPGKTDMPWSLSDMVVGLSAVPERVLLRLERPVLKRVSNTHESASIAFVHRWQGPPVPELDDGTHRIFWARQRSHEDRRGTFI